MAALTREALLTKRIVITREVEIDGLGMVRVRELTVAESKTLASDFKDKNAEAAVYIVQRCVVDDSGEPLLGADDTDAIESLGVATLNNLVTAVLAVSGMKADAPAPKA